MVYKYHLVLHSLKTDERRTERMTELESFKLMICPGDRSIDWFGTWLGITQPDEGMRVAGLRTYGLIALMGGIWALIARQADPS